MSGKGRGGPGVCDTKPYLLKRMTKADNSYDEQVVFYMHLPRNFRGDTVL